MKATLERLTYPQAVFVNDVPGERHFPYRFERDESVSVISVVHGEREWLRGDHVPHLASAPSEYQVYVGHYRSYNPWGSNFRIVVRGPRLLMIVPSGDEA